MYYDDLFNIALMQPATSANCLKIVSGYATSAMAFNHLKRLSNNINIQLIVGMCPRDGLSKSNHQGFKKLVDEDYRDTFQCSYIENSPAVHSKVYVWCQDDKPVCAYTGSANYTQTSFFSSQHEILTECNPETALHYYNTLDRNTIYCNHIEVENVIKIFHDKSYLRYSNLIADNPISTSDSVVKELVALESIQVSLLNRDGVVSSRSSLNWGQRPEEHREPNQAYIPLKSKIYNSSFFPNLGVDFTVLTDDNKVLICTRAQQNGKAIHTPHNNSLIGIYFRNRLGVQEGRKVTKEHLEAYGRNYLTFFKIDDETYFMDFSV